jgi:hypothetical protein
MKNRLLIFEPLKKWLKLAALPHVKVHIISIPFSNSLPSDVLGG